MTIGLAQADAQGQDERLLALTRQAEFGERVENVQVLIQNGADVIAATARDDTHSTPLHLASFKGFGDTVKVLI